MDARLSIAPLARSKTSIAPGTSRRQPASNASAAVDSKRRLNCKHSDRKACLADWSKSAPGRAVRIRSSSSVCSHSTSSSSIMEPLRTSVVHHELHGLPPPCAKAENLRLQRFSWLPAELWMCHVRHFATNGAPDVQRIVGGCVAAPPPPAAAEASAAAAIAATSQPSGAMVRTSAAKPPRMPAYSCRSLCKTLCKLACVSVASCRSWAHAFCASLSSLTSFWISAKRCLAATCASVIAASSFLHATDSACSLSRTTPVGASAHATFTAFASSTSRNCSSS
mmetsp:Transcript_20285/g.56338  ORF Transcript_20285/g.56338 Transcript_20285/m.56338 type:complete len:281 (-) Transcript_20285:899-1741(-)